ncbi:MAG: GNAT family protein [Gammaproteobacteria bacterium]|nr:GNAT family protein [Gammaproteobacteria bacterium]MDE0192053.1 GNAT family protein [Gammaproteobacteria bacterium]
MNVTLRRVRPGDRDTFMAWFRDPSLTRWHGDPGPRERDNEFRRIVRSRYNFVTEADGVPVGHVAVECDWDNATSAELGICVEPGNQRRGIGKTALARVIDFAFEEAGASRLWAGVVSSNAAALRLCQRVGLAEDRRVPDAALEDGHWIDHVYFSVLSGEWRRIEPVLKT